MASPENPLNKLFPPCYRPRLVAVAVFAILTLILVLLPFAIAWWLEGWLVEQGAAKAEVRNVDFNPFNGALVVEGVSATDPQGGRLSLERGAVEIDWWPLFRRRLYLHDLVLRNGYVDVMVTEEGVPVIGPLRFPPDEEEAEEEEEAAPFGFGVEGIVLEDIRIDYRDPRVRRDVRIDRFATEALFTWDPEQQSPFVLSLAVGEGTFRIEGTTRPFGSTPSIDAQLTVEDFPVGWLEPLLEPQGFGDLRGRMQAEADLRLTSHGEEVPGLELKLDGLVGLEGLQAQSEAVDLRRGDLSWQGMLDWRSAPAGELPALDAEGEATLSGVELVLHTTGVDLHQRELAVSGRATLPGGADAVLQLHLDLKAQGHRLDDRERGLNLLQLERLAAEDLRMDGPAELSAAALRAGGVKLLQQPDGSGREGRSHILSIDGLSVAQPVLTDLRRLTIAAVRVDGAGLDLVRGADGKLALQRWTGGSRQKGAAAGEAKAGDGKGVDFSFAIGRVVVGKSHFAFVDRKIEPTFEYRLEDVGLRMENLDQSAPSQPSPVHLEARSGRYGALQFDGTATPFAEEFGLDLSGTVKSLELPRFNPYATKIIGYRVVSGHLGADLGVKVAGGDLDAEADLVLTRFDVEPAAGEAAAQEVDRRIGVPLESALALMRDKDDIIKLDLSVKGDLDNPRFNVGEIVMSVLTKAIKKGMVSYYAPVGLSVLTGAAVPIGATYVAGKLLDLVTALRFDPVVFRPLQADLDSDSRGRLEKIAQRLADRPEVRLVLCGKATIAEMKKSEDGKPLSKEQTEGLRRLAEERSRAVKGFLAGLGIEADRLLICSPEVESGADTEPRVEIGI